MNDNVVASWVSVVYFGQGFLGKVAFASSEYHKHWLSSKINHVPNKKQFTYKRSFSRKGLSKRTFNAQKASNWIPFLWFTLYKIMHLTMKSIRFLIIFLWLRSSQNSEVNNPPYSTSKHFGLNPSIYKLISTCLKLPNPALNMKVDIISALGRKTKQPADG